MFIYETKNGATMITAHSISVPKAPSVEHYVLPDLRKMTPGEARMDLFQTTGSSPPDGDWKRDPNLAQHSEGYRMSKVRIRRGEVA